MLAAVKVQVNMRFHKPTKTTLYYSTGFIMHSNARMCVVRVYVRLSACILESNESVHCIFTLSDFVTHACNALFQCCECDSKPCVKYFRSFQEIEKNEKRILNLPVSRINKEIFSIETLVITAILAR